MQGMSDGLGTNGQQDPWFRGDDTEGTRPVEHNPPAEPTHPLPPFEPAPAAAKAKRPLARNGLAAGVLAGALVLGGAAGVGGAAWYDAWQGIPTASSQARGDSTSGGVISANDATLKAGTVEAVAAKVLPTVVKINVVGNSGEGSGSGIVLTSDGQILTNNHVVSSMGSGSRVSVNFNDGKTVHAKVLGTDPLTDIAVIKAEGVSNLPTATIGKSGALKVGQDVVAIGSPYGLNATVTSGIVSALHRPVSVQTAQQQAPQVDPFGFGQEPQSPQGPDLSTTYPAIQTDAAINPGNSGGPLVDMAGRVIGINSSIRTSGSSSSGSIGLGFAIPMDEVLPIVNQIVAGETPTHARLGVSVSDVSSSSLETGAKIAAIDGSGAAAGGGLKVGDVITRIDDQVVTSSESLVATVRGHRPDDSVKITFVRAGNDKSLTIKLGSDAKTKTS